LGNPTAAFPGAQLLRHALGQRQVVRHTMAFFCGSFKPLPATSMLFFLGEPRVLTYTSIFSKITSLVWKIMEYFVFILWNNHQKSLTRPYAQPSTNFFVLQS
jgi:hypothetical protein